MAKKPKQVTSKEKGKDSSTLAFYSAENFARMKWLRMKLAKLRSKLKDKELAEVADDFNVIEEQFDRMYHRVGEEIWISDERQSVFFPEYGPTFRKIGRKGRIPTKRLESLKKIPGLKIQFRLPGEEKVQYLKPVNKDKDVSD
jgi:septation ring formation regulator EzrA